ncbi:ATPase domain-containing protein [Verrucomicrobiota bacterium sgz303538]
MNEDATERRIDRCTTGIDGLDDVLCGGLPRNRLYLIQGTPGVGKTTLALQFLMEGARQGETGLYITLSETKEELHAVAESHDWHLDKINLFELSALEEQLKNETDSTFFRPSEVELNRTSQILLDEVERLKPQRVVLDSLSELRLLAETPLRYRRQILHLKQFFAGRRCTVLLLDDHSADVHDLHVESIAHGVIALFKSSPEYGVSRRYLNVHKIRGMQFKEGNHDFILRKGGMAVFPRLVASEHRINFQRESFPSGIAELDALLGGGLDRGTSNMFMGPPGTGKSTLAAMFAYTAATRGEKVHFFTFDETSETLLARSEALGMPLGSHLASGTVRLEQIDPAEISPGELAHRIRCGVQRDGVRMVVIDSLNGYLNAMPAERYMNLQLHEMLAFLNQQGVVTIMVLAQQGIVGNMQSVVDLTYLADTVLLLRYFEVRGAIKQAVSVIKKRSGNHERTIREIRVDKDGIHLSRPLSEMHGILTGIPSFESTQDEPPPSKPVTE